jgi:hypothetical protein
VSAPELPAGHVTGRWLIIAAIVVAVLFGAIWFYINKIQTGDVTSWYYVFEYEQERWFNVIYYSWKFPWE